MIIYLERKINHNVHSFSPNPKNRISLFQFAVPSFLRNTAILRFPSAKPSYSPRVLHSIILRVLDLIANSDFAPLFPSFLYRRRRRSRSLPLRNILCFLFFPPREESDSGGKHFLSMFVFGFEFSPPSAINRS